MRVNPSDGFNGPVTFADRANRFQLNQFNLFIQRDVPSEGSEWDIGGITPKTHLVVHHTHGWASKIFLGNEIRNAEWYSINTHLTYNLLNDLSIGIRAERFTDRNGWRVFSPYRILSATNNRGISYAGNIPYIGAPANYYAVTWV